MKTLPVRRLALICLAIALAWIFACSDDTTCPAPKTCPDPAKALSGLWVVFESFVGGDPDQFFVGTAMSFLPHDSLLMAIPGMGSGAFRWVANDSTFLMAAMSSSTNMLFRYEFDADTLIMEEKTAYLDVRWKLSK